MLSSPLLPHSLIPHCLDILLKGTTEKDFSRILVELIQSLRNETLSDEEEDEEQSEAGQEGREGRKQQLGAGVLHPDDVREKEERKRELEGRCLIMVRGGLERVMGVSLSSSS